MKIPKVVFKNLEDLLKDVYKGDFLSEDDFNMYEQIVKASLATRDTDVLCHIIMTLMAFITEDELKSVSTLMLDPSCLKVIFGNKKYYEKYLAEE